MRGGEEGCRKERRRVTMPTRAPAQWREQLPCWRGHLLSAGMMEEEEEEEEQGHSRLSDGTRAAAPANPRINNPQVLI